jgi:hypothetical protein
VQKAGLIFEILKNVEFLFLHQKTALFNGKKDYLGLEQFLILSAIGARKVCLLSFEDIFIIHF